MSGLRGELDDCYELAELLNEKLRDAELTAADNGEPSVRVQRIRGLKVQADDLANGIDRQRTALRGS